MQRARVDFSGENGGGLRDRGPGPLNDEQQAKRSLGLTLRPQLHEKMPDQSVRGMRKRLCPLALAALETRPGGT